jgi:hypothetical protein
LLQILTNRMGEMIEENRFYKEAIGLYNRLRAAGLEKVPATAELLAWVAYLRQRGFTSLDDKDIVRQSLAVLVKSEEDMVKAASVV